MNFTASLDKTAKITTIIVTILFIAIIIYGFAESSSTKSILYTACFLTVVYGICWLLRPISYTVTDTELQIQRAIGTVTIKKQDIKRVDVLQEFNIGGTIRTFGVGGLFGYYGKYYNNTFGSMTWYLTRSDKPVLVTTVKSKIVLSPDEPEHFAETLRKIN